MAVSEASRHQLYRQVEHLMGHDNATTLMELLPPVGWADVATKHGLAALEERLSMRFDAMDVKFEARFGVVDHGFGAMDHKFEAMDAKFEARFGAMDHKFEAMDYKFEAMDHKLEAMGHKFEAALHREVSALKSTMLLTMLLGQLTLAAIIFTALKLA